MSESFISEVVRSNQLRMDDDYSYSIDNGKMIISQPQLYGDLNERIVEQGEGATEELKDLAGKAEFIDKPPAFSRQSVRSNIFTFLNNLGINPENSEFVSNLLAGDPSTEIGALDLVGAMAVPEIVEGTRQFKAGLKEGDAGTAGMGALRTGFGVLEATPAVGMGVKTLKQPVKDTIGLLANKAREYKANQTPGTKLLSTDPTDPTVDAIIKLDELVNKPQGPELTGSSGELGFYSKALEETKKLQQKKGTGQQFRQMLKKAGVSDDEIEWSGLNVVLSKDKTTKKEIEDQLRLNKLEIREVVKDKLPEETRMNWDSAYSRSNADPNYIKSADDLKEGELYTSQSAKINSENLMTPEEVFGPNYIDGRADEIANETMAREGNEMDIDLARAEALREFYDDPFIRIEDQNSGMVILGNDSVGYSIYPDMQSTKGEGAFKNAFKTLDYMRNPIPSLSEAKVQAQEIAIDKGLMSFGDEGMVRFSDDSYRLAGGENYREFVITSDKYDSFVGPSFHGGHFDESNVIGHFRTSDRETMNGERVLYIDEIQSDWGQKGREKGFKKDIDDPNDSGQIVRGPFVENTPKWTDLMVKRILAKAVEEGYDMVSFSPGYIQNMRWGKKGLLKYYDDILVKRVTKIVDKLDDTAFGAGNEEIGQINARRDREGFGRVHLQDDDITELAEEAYNETQDFDFNRDQILEPFTVRITNKLKEGVKKGQSLFALPVVAGATAMTMEGDDG